MPAKKSSKASNLPGIGFLGAGKMATALAQGWLNAKLINPAKTFASDPYEKARDHFTEVTSCKTLTDNQELVNKCETVVLAVKPGDVHHVLENLSRDFETKHLLISIAAGVSLTQLAELIGFDQRIIRVMPNTPCLVGASASAYAVSLTATDEDKTFIDKLLSAVGKAFAVPEKLLNAVTGLSGSGPAFVYLMIEALTDGGVRVGLPRDVAQALATQTVYGAARMVLETEQHPVLLKDAVASPGGTTMAGLHALEEGKFRSVVMSAVQAATERAEELGKIH